MSLFSESSAFKDTHRKEEREEEERKEKGQDSRSAGIGQ
jgi:hypothetical protein